MSQSVLALIGPRLTEHALDVAVPHARPRPARPAGGPVPRRRCCVDFVVEYGGTLLTTYIGQRVMYDLRMQIFGHLQRLSISYFDRNPVGRLMTRVTSDVETLNELFSSGVVTIFGDAFTLVAIMGMMLAIDVRLALVTFAVIPLVWLTASDLPAAGPRGLRRHPGAAGPPQRLPAGAAERDAGGAALRPGGGHGAPVRRRSTGITSRRTSARSRSTRCSSRRSRC